MSSYGRLAKVGAVWGFMARGMTEVVGIPTAMVLARVLSPSDFGLAAAAGFFVQIAQRLTNFGFNTAIVQIKELTPLHRSTVLFINVVAGGLVWVLLTAGAPWLGSWFDSTEAVGALRVTAVTFIVSALGSVSTSLLARDLRFRALTVIDWLTTWTNAVVAVSLALSGQGYWSLIYAQVASVSVAAVARLYVAGWWPSLVFSRSAFRELVAFGLGLHTKRLLDSAAQNLDNLVVGKTLGIDALGFYDKAFSMMHRAVNLLSSAGPTVSLRILSIVSDEGQRFRNAYSKVLLLSTFVAYPVFAFLAAAAPELFAVMFGPRWAAAVWPFRVLCLVGALKFVNAYASIATQAKGRVWGEVWRQVIYIALLVIGVAIGSRSGLTGAAAGVLAATCVVTLLMQGFLSSTTGVTWRDSVRAQLPGAVCAAGLLLLLTALRTVSGVAATTFWSSLAVLTVGLCSSVLFCLAFVHLAGFRDLRNACWETVSELAPRLKFLLPRPESEPIR